MVKRVRVTKAPEDRRQDLLDAGLRVLVERGRDATVAEIADVAGVAKGTFYLYFGSKDDLVLALRDRLTAAFVDDVMAGWDTGDAADWWRVIDRTVEKLIDFLLENRDVHEVLFHGVPGTNAVSAGQLDTWTLMTGFVRQGVAAGVFAVSDPEVMVTLLFSAVHGAVDAAFERREVDRQRLVGAARELVHKTLAP